MTRTFLTTTTTLNNRQNSNHGFLYPGKEWLLAKVIECPKQKHEWSNTPESETPDYEYNQNVLTYKCRRCPAERYKPLTDLECEKIFERQNRMYRNWRFE